MPPLSDDLFRSINSKDQKLMNTRDLSMDNSDRVNNSEFMSLKEAI
jgi:hypothetical protein